MPCSRSLSPLWYGVGIRPAKAPNCLRLRICRLPKNSITYNEALLTPMPRRFSSLRTLATGCSSEVRMCRARSFCKSLICLSTNCQRSCSRSRLCCKAAGTGCWSQVRSSVRSWGPWPSIVVTANPQAASSPLSRLTCWVRSSFTSSKSRCNCRRSSSATLGTWTTLQTFFFPRC
jgi:hypothetical protein